MKKLGHSSSSAKVSPYAALDILATFVALVSPDAQIRFVNSSFEDIYGLSSKAITKLNLQEILSHNALLPLLHDVANDKLSTGRFEGVLIRPSDHTDIPVQVIISPSGQKNLLVVEMLPIEQQVRVDRENRFQNQALANKALIRNLAHEIKNPLGGIRGAAQLLQMEMPTQEFTEYTQVIIQEADRLQMLVDRLLEPHRRPLRMDTVNIHEVCEHVAALILAEFPNALEIVRDYDTSIPEFKADQSQLIQIVLNIAKNAAQSLIAQPHTQPIIEFQTRIAKQTPYAKSNHKLSLELHIIDNGSGIPEEIKDRIFYPLVSGRAGGSGLGLMIAQTYVQQHHGMIECHSQLGRTDFAIFIPLLST